MSALTIIRDIKAVGGNLRLIDGGLKVSAPPGKMTPGMLIELKEHKPEILAALLMGGKNLPGMDQGLDSERAILRCPVGELESGGLKLGRQRNCLLCGLPLDQDGGDCWHRAFHVGDDSPTLGCHDQPPKVGAATSSPISEKAAAGPRCDDQVKTIQPHVREQINVVAVTWLRENRQGLKAAGWSCRELYRRNISPGILFSPIWEKPFLKTTLLDHGDIEFEFVDAGRDCINVARPMPQRKIKSKRKNKL